MTDANTLASVTMAVGDATHADRGLPVDMTRESGSDGRMDGLRSFAE